VVLLEDSGILGCVRLCRWVNRYRRFGGVVLRIFSRTSNNRKPLYHNEAVQEDCVDLKIKGTVKPA